ncbi:MAG TPA: hypothetical protein VFL31_06485 [Nitrospiraceae bacterium]|nr:hypothetical protein [Nitrospiraceae bacterium]
MRPPRASWRLPLAWAVLVFSGCLLSSKVKTETLPAVEKYRVKTVVVMPFEELSTPQIADSMSQELLVPGGAKRSDISVSPPPSPDRKDRPTITVPAYAGGKVAEIVYRKLLNREGVRALSPDEAAQAIKVLGPAVQGLASDHVARQVAGRLSADAALLGKVLVYQERVGSKLGADPAAVGFEVKLIAADGETLWVGNYYEKQRPMNEDLLGFVQRWGFVTAEELAEYGAEHVIRDFPYGGRSPRSSSS